MNDHDVRVKVTVSCGLPLPDARRPSGGVSVVVMHMGGDVVDTSTAIGKLLITVLAGIDEFEVDLLKERRLEGIAAAKACGVHKGRPRTYTAHHKELAHALELLAARDRNHLTVNDICAMTQVSRATLYRLARQTERPE